MSHYDLVAAARQEMIERGFSPDFSRAEQRQLDGIDTPATPGGLRDLASLLWSSIDNDDSRDLDQIEWAERTRDGIRVLVGVADVDAELTKATPLDCHAQREATAVYAGVHTFPMLPEKLSTNLTSLNEDQDRAAIVIEMTVSAEGAISGGSIYRAMVRNRAQLAYNGAGAWLEGGEAPPKIAASTDLQAQLKLQDEAARALYEARHRLGALTFDRTESQPVFDNSHIKDITTRRTNRASHLIEDFMIAANEVMAQTLREAGVSSIRRIVREPERWPRIVDLARQRGENLPPEPDSGALNVFLMRQKQRDPDHYADISLAVLKLMGPGEYVVMRPGDPPLGHFGIAAHDYTHSTAPNRRFADLLTQRLLKARAAPAPYSDGELAAIARNCTLKEDAARKIRRDMDKRMAALAFHDRAGEIFSAVVTGVVPKGVFVRALHPPLEGRLMHGEHGLDVGDRLKVKLLSTDPWRGFIDFGRV